MRQFILLLVLCITVFSLQAQNDKKIPLQKPADGKTTDINTRQKPQLQRSVPPATPSIFQQLGHIHSIPYLPAINEEKEGFEIIHTPNGMPVYIKGEIEQSLYTTNNNRTRAIEYLTALKDILKLNQPEQELVLLTEFTDDLGMSHLKFQQVHKGVEVYGGQYVVHIKDGYPYCANGRLFSSLSENALPVNTPNVQMNQAIAKVQANMRTKTKVVDLPAKSMYLLDGPQWESEMVVFYGFTPDVPEGARLAWHVTARPNLFERWEYYVDALSGEILTNYHNGCQIAPDICTGNHDHSSCSTHHDHTSAADADKLYTDIQGSGQDLFNQNRTFRAWQDGSTRFMIDASRPMFNNSLSNMPNEPVGAIWTIDAQNIVPASDGSLDLVHITSGSNSFNNKTGVSAHVHAADAYEYFANTFNRNSINGQGGNIVFYH